MNKPVVVLGFLFWAGLSGIMGIKLLEGYVEDAVSAALSSIPAKAEEVKFSYLTKKVTLNHISFDIPLEKKIFKGNIDSMTLTGFNKKVLFVFPNMPLYNPQDISPVAKAINIKSLSGNYHSGFTEINFSAEEIELNNWKQRLGLLLDHYARHGVKKGFIEEFARCSLENASAQSIKINGTNSITTQKIKINASNIGLERGIQPAINNGEPYPIPLTVKNLSVHIEKNGEGQRNFNREYVQLSLEDTTTLTPLIKLAQNVLSNEEKKINIVQVLDGIR